MCFKASRAIGLKVVVPFVEVAGFALSIANGQASGHISWVADTESVLVGGVFVRASDANLGPPVREIRISASPDAVVGGSNSWARE